MQDILENFEFRNQIPRLSKADALGTLIEKLLSPDINLSPNASLECRRLRETPGLDNHGMGTVFEELVRRFNDENNEEAGEHWTPRDAVALMAKLIFLPIADEYRVRHVPPLRRSCGTGPTGKFLSSILPYTNADWEKLSIFLTFLVLKLPARSRTICPRASSSPSTWIATGSKSRQR